MNYLHNVKKIEGSLIHLKPIIKQNISILNIQNEKFDNISFKLLSILTIW